jgi:CheY-like chemotaxis protein
MAGSPVNIPRVHVLIVEDDEEQADAFVSACRAAQIAEPPIVEVASNREDALEFIEKTHFDLVVCDLAIPLNGSFRTPDRRNGRAVLQTLLDQRGTPIIVSSEGEEAIGGLIKYGAQADPFGQGADLEMLCFHNKEEILECKRQITQFVEWSGRVAAIELQGDDLGAGEIRAIQVYAHRSEGVLAKLSPLGGSSAEMTFRLEVVDSAGHSTSNVVAKVGDRSRILREAEKGRTVARRLPPDLILGQADVVDAGAGCKGGVFYGFADRFDRSLFVCLESDVGAACSVVDALRDAFSSLHASARPEDKKFFMLRREIVGSDRLANLAELEARVRALDEWQIAAGCCIQHGDLHGENVLVDRSGRPILIDYGQTGIASGCLDPVTLELSAIFHPGAQQGRGAWPSERQLASWQDLDFYLAGCPFPEFVRKAREWAVSVAESPEEVDAVALAYGLRQLRYDEAVRHLALALVDGVSARIGEA